MGDVLSPLTSAAELRAWAQLHLGLKLAPAGVCPGHVSPLEYLWRAYAEPARDLVVWAPRGGGKTRLGAAATLLDLLHKPPCHVRILGGSLQQSLRMWDYLWEDVLKLAEDSIDGKKLAQRLKLTNGSTAQVLAQSQRAVRGLHVQKLRCDEVELFDPAVWEAAQLVTRSTPAAAGVIEALSTMHRPWGLMRRIVELAEQNRTPIIKWCVLDVLERCDSRYECEACVLHEDCNGLAKRKCDGFFRIDDAIAMKRRVSKETWLAEMLCRTPNVQFSVFPTFSHFSHVRDELSGRSDEKRELWLAMDFGFAAPFVCLWIFAYADGTAHVVDEYVQPAQTMPNHVKVIEARKWGKAFRVACDPAGRGRNDQTGKSNVDVLRAAGFSVKSSGSQIVDGVNLIRAALDPAVGAPRLYIAPRCQRLIKALQAYHYNEAGSELPVKDGVYDHPIDALRYFYVNWGKGALSDTRRY